APQALQPGPGARSLVGLGFVVRVQENAGINEGPGGHGAHPDLDTVGLRVSISPASWQESAASLRRTRATRASHVGATRRQSATRSRCFALRALAPTQRSLHPALSLRSSRGRERAARVAGDHNNTNFVYFQATPETIGKTVTHQIKLRSYLRKSAGV